MKPGGLLGAQYLPGAPEGLLSGYYAEGRAPELKKKVFLVDYIQISNNSFSSFYFYWLIYLQCTLKELNPSHYTTIYSVFSAN